jgi:hypothetical protein
MIRAELQRQVGKAVILASGLAAGALVFAGAANATPFGDGCVATHGKVGSSQEGQILHESCTWGYKNGGAGWTEYQDTNLLRVQQVPPVDLSPDQN